MVIKNISNALFQSDDMNITQLLRNNFLNELLDVLYFKPKRVNKNIIEKKLNNKEYINKVKNTIEYFKNKDLEMIIKEKFEFFENETSNKLGNEKLYIIIGLDTTTIYSVKMNDEDVTVLLLESTNGSEQRLDMLLAHEFTHFIRKQKLNKNIFEDSIGERFVTEGIGCNYSREMVPNMTDSDYCILDNETVKWVKNNIDKIEECMAGKINNPELMNDYFSMTADPSIIGMPIRTGYVYGYLKVKNYLEKNNLTIKDIIGIDWKKILEK